LRNNFSRLKTHNIQNMILVFVLLGFAMYIYVALYLSLPDGFLRKIGSYSTQNIMGNCIKFILPYQWIVTIFAFFNSKKIIQRKIIFNLSLLLAIITIALTVISLRFTMLFHDGGIMNIH